MRKTLIQTLLVAFCAILAHAPLEGGGVMLIGMRNAMLSGGWKNPYITDGLVAMWDGEWNAGGGLHDPSLTTWKDLVGTFDLVKSDMSTSATWGDNYLLTNDRWGYNDASLASVLYGTSLTYEVCVDAVAANPRTGAVFGVQDETVGILAVSGTLYDWSYNSGASSLGTNKGTVVNQFFDSFSHFFANGAYVKTGTRKTSSYRNRTIGVCYCYVGSYGAKVDNLKVYCGRIYSRALTADEIAANYAVDKARFNLP